MLPQWWQIMEHTPFLLKYIFLTFIQNAPLANHNDWGFSVPAFASRASARQAVSPAGASLQTGSSTGFSFFVFLPWHLTPDIWHLKSWDLVLGIWYFAMLHYSTTPLLQETIAWRKDAKSSLWGWLKVGSSVPDFLLLYSYSHSHDSLASRGPRFPANSERALHPLSPSFSTEKGVAGLIGQQKQGAQSCRQESKWIVLNYNQNISTTSTTHIWEKKNISIY